MIGVIGDIHGNLEALEAVLEELEEKKVDDVVCLGDIVGYGASPNECCEIVKKMNLHCVMGDHDYAAATGKLLNWFDPVAQEALKWTNKKLDKKNKIFLSVLPRKLTLELQGVKLGLVHGSPWDELFEYVQPTVKDSTLKKFLEEMECQALALGHTHIPFAKSVDARLVFNPGAVGQPRDGISMASYALLEPDNLKAKVVRKEYDVESAALKMKLANLPAFLQERLYEGI
jgi:putative phosphoesterase